MDVILAVGYRVTSKVATQFKKLATNVLHKYIVDGYAINEEKLKQEQFRVKTLQDTIQLLSRSLTNQVENLDDGQRIAKIMSNYAKGLNLLDSFTIRRLIIKGKQKHKP